MAHYAELDENNIVLRVIVIADSDTFDVNGNESEVIGIDFCKKLFGENTKWLKTSYNTVGNQHLLGGTPFRKNYAGIGFSYDPVRDAFIAPSMVGDGWYLDEDSCIWRNSIIEAAAQSSSIGVTRV